MRVAFVCLFVASLAACTGPSPRPPLSDQQLERLTRLETWEISGRLGLRDGQQGGSGRLDWAQSPIDSELRFVGPFSQGSWRLNLTPEQARLELSDDEVYRADTLDQLLVETIGWDIPVEALSWWIKGLPDPKYSFQASQAEGDRLETLEQLGWLIEYRDFMPVESLFLPRRITASRGTEQIKLLIRHWRLP